MNDFVLDTSIAVKWFLEDESDRGYSLAILKKIIEGSSPIVPWLWYYEIAGTLLKQVRRQRVAFDEILVYLSLIDDMKIETDPPDSSAILQLPKLGRAYNLSSYDAAFLELAKRLQLPLATSDQALTRAASEYGVELLVMSN